MNINDSITRKAKEIERIESYLDELDKEYNNQLSKIEHLDNELNDNMKNFKIFDSTLLKSIFGKQSKFINSNLDRIKSEFFYVATELNNYESTISSLEYRKKILSDKLEANKKYIKNILNILDHKQKTNIELTKKQKDDVEFYSNLIDYKIEFIDNLEKIISLLDLHIQHLKNLFNDLSSNLDQDNFLIKSNLPKSLLVNEVHEQISNSSQFIETANNSYINLEIALLETIENFTFIGEEILSKIKSSLSNNFYIEIRFGENFRTLEEISKNISNHAYKFIYIKSLILLEIEIAKKDITVFKDTQLDIMKENLNIVEN